MNPLDEAIRQALSADDATALDRYAADPSLVQQVADAFRGRLALLNAFSWIVGLALFGVGLYCAWRFMTAADVASMLRWLGGAGLAALGLTMVKLWFWLELQSNAVIREVKRLELQVARLASR
jgi:hypothetical protein